MELSYEQLCTMPLAQLSREQILFAATHCPRRDVGLWHSVAIALFGADLTVDAVRGVA